MSARKGKDEWQVISPDGFSIEADNTYPSLQSAKNAFKKWKKRFELQGYYSSVVHGNIDLSDLENFCEFNRKGTRKWRIHF